MDTSDLLPDPLAQFARWLEEARAGGVELPEAMTLATADAAGCPSARTVLLKSVDGDGFRFFTNTGSRKARELADNPDGALVFHWPLDPRRQITVTGTVEPLPRDESEAYFRTRPLGSRLGAWASHQSEVVPDRETLERAFAEARRVLRPGGRLVMTTPNSGALPYLALRLLPKRVAHRVLGRWVQQNLHPEIVGGAHGHPDDHKREGFTLDELERGAKAEGFETEELFTYRIPAPDKMLDLFPHRISALLAALGAHPLPGGLELFAVFRKR